MRRWRIGVFQCIIWVQTAMERQDWDFNAAQLDVLLSNIIQKASEISICKWKFHDPEAKWCKDQGSSPMRMSGCITSGEDLTVVLLNWICLIPWLFRSSHVPLNLCEPYHPSTDLRHFSQQELGSNRCSPCGRNVLPALGLYSPKISDGFFFFSHE